MKWFILRFSLDTTALGTREEKKATKLIMGVRKKNVFGFINTSKYVDEDLRFYK